MGGKTIPERPSPEPRPGHRVAGGLRRPERPGQGQVRGRRANTRGRPGCSPMPLRIGAPVEPVEGVEPSSLQPGMQDSHPRATPACAHWITSRPRGDEDTPAFLLVVHREPNAHRTGRGARLRPWQPRWESHPPQRRMTSLVPLTDEPENRAKDESGPLFGFQCANDVADFCQKRSAERQNPTRREAERALRPTELRRGALVVGLLVARLAESLTVRDRFPGNTKEPLPCGSGSSTSKDNRKVLAITLRSPPSP